MRMARIKVKDRIKVAPINPAHVVDFYIDDDNDTILRTIKEDDGWILDMPLDEAVAELNAAMAESLPAVDVPFYLKREAKVLNEPISTLGLFTTAYNACVKNNIRNIRDLTDATEADLSKLPRLGSTCLREIRNKLSNFGLHIGCTRND